jgi:quercetin dioxygenase-like cupin family protein
MSIQMQAFTLRPGEGPSIRNPLGGPLTFKLRGVESNGAMMVLESEIPPGEGPPLHIH